MTNTEIIVMNELQKYYGIGKYSSIRVINKETYLDRLVSKYGKRIVTRVHEYVKTNLLGDNSTTDQIDVPIEKMVLVEDTVNPTKEYYGELVNPLLEEYAEAWKQYKELEKKLELIKDMALMELSHREDDYTSESGVNMKVVTAFRPTVSSKFTSYDYDEVKAALGSSKSKLIPSITEKVINADKLEGLVKAGKLPETLLNIKKKSKSTYITCHKK